MSYQDIIANFQQQQEAARAANEARYAESLKLYDEIIKQYQPEGGFLKGAEAELGREKVRTVAGQEQKLVSSGLFGTSTTAGLGSKWEAEVGQPARLKLEDVRMGRLAQALGAKAGAIERREDIGPDYATIAALSQQAASRPTVMYSGGGSSGYDQLAAQKEAAAQRQAAAYAQTSAQRFQERMMRQQQSAQERAARLAYQRQLELARRGRAQAGAPGGPSGMQMTNAQLQDLLANQPGAGGYGTQQLSQDIFGAMSGFASQAAGAMGAGGTTGGVPPDVQSFKDYYNYASTLYKQTGEKLSQQEAFSKLKGMGWSG